VTRPFLVDVNILIALFDPAHVHHDLAHEWFGDNRSRGWATTPLTENAVLRIIANPKYGSNSERAGQVAPRLQAFCAADDHRFWPATISLCDPAQFNLAFASHRHLADVYLLALAKVNGGVLATFDRSIPLKAVSGATPDLLEVIGEG
jgi:hypothetical protein